MTDAEKIAAGREAELAETKAYREEQLAAAFFIAAALFFAADWPVVGWIMLAIAMVDTISAIVAWLAVLKLRKILEREA